MTLMTLTAYGATHGATRQAAKKWQDRGSLVMSDGLVDADASDLSMKSHGKGRFRQKAHGGRRTAGVHGKIDRPGLALREVPQMIPKRPRLSAEEAKYRARIARWTAGNPHGLGGQIEREVLAIVAEVQEKAGLAVDVDALIDMADAVVHCQVDDDAMIVGWYRWPETIAGLVAADLGLEERSDEIRASLERRVADRIWEIRCHDLDEIAEIELYVDPL